jgi:hypothetical protein
MKRKAIANIQQSCSDSPWFANPMDGVFGTDNGHLMSQGDKLKFQACAATKAEGEQRNEGGKNRTHAHDGMATSCRILDFCRKLEF